MEDIQIAFDLSGFQEYFIKYKINPYNGKLSKGKKKKYYIFEKQKPTPNNLGTFLLDFLNTNFTDKNECKDFIFEYLFVNLLVRINKDIYFNSEIHGKKNLILDITKVHFEIILSEEEIEYYYNKIYEDFKYDLIENQKIYESVCNFNYFKSLADTITSKSKAAKLKKEEIPALSKNETYFSSLANIATTTLFLKVNFYLRPFYTDKNKDYFIENVPYSFSSKMYSDILFISFREFVNTKKNIYVQKCENCGRYFIPSTAHDTKYCDFLFDGKKTCKQIGIEKAYLDNLDKDVLLKKYRSRYQSLSKSAGTSSKNSKAIKMYEYYKKTGPVMQKRYKDGKISGKIFEEWIESTKLK